MIPMELKVSISYKLLVACVSTVERETGPFKMSKHELILYYSTMPQHEQIDTV